MKIAERLAAKDRDFANGRVPTVVFLGDSVTHGCFELYIKSNGNPETYVDQDHSYQTDVGKILHLLYPGCPVNIVNAGISGNTAKGGLDRLERDVLSYRPDLVVVCFGLNDACQGKNYLPTYLDSLEKIFTEVKAAGAEVIFMTPNMMATEISPKLKERREQKLVDMANACIDVQTAGVLDLFLSEGKKVAEKAGVRIADVYEKWKAMQAAGVNITALLSNDINHPAREMHWLFAASLVEEMLR